jgi:hypothetical protein
MNLIIHQETFLLDSTNYKAVLTQAGKIVFVPDYVLGCARSAVCHA